MLVMMLLMLVMILTEVLINGCGEDGDDDDNDDGDIAVDREVVRGISESMKVSLSMAVLIKLLMNEDNAYSLILVTFFCAVIKKICD